VLIYVSFENDVHTGKRGRPSLKAMFNIDVEEPAEGDEDGEAQFLKELEEIGRDDDSLGEVICI
jgi:hypothetical protein